MSIANAALVAEIPTTAIGGAVCSGCGAGPRQNLDGTHERIVATGWYVEYEGLVVFCETCITFLGSLVGLVDPEEGKARASDVRRAQRRETAMRAAEIKVLDAIEAADAAATALRDMQSELST